MSAERWSDSEVMQFGSMQTLLGHILTASHEHTGTPRRISGRESWDDRGTTSTMNVFIS